VNKAVLTYISALVGFLGKIVTSVHGYGHDKLYSIKLKVKVKFTLLQATKGQSGSGGIALLFL